MKRLPLRVGAVTVVAVVLGGLPPAGGKPPLTGPATEKRFPPLKVPAGFQATLFACDPLIEYPSAIALGPRPNSVFVAVDYMTGLGTAIVRRDEIRLVEDADGDGYADRATVFASGFNSIQGLAYHDGTVYVMHAPFLSALRERDGKAGERRDLLKGLGLPPEENPPRLHCANGLVVGHDGWLYLALGDHGCDVTRPEGDRLVLHGGGILRCRPDGRDLHVFATGLRNIYDVALDAELNVFVRDNENDGGDYKIRVCHSFFGADHGYPYHYDERPDEALPPLADLGLGSSAGGLVYLERQFPPEYRGALFFCEWGRSVVRYHPRRAGSAFGPVQEVEFAAGADNDPYGFKPTDLVVERDGSLLVADWADGQQPKRGRGRIYRIRHAGGSPPAPREGRSAVARLDSDSYYRRVAAQQALLRRGTDGASAVVEGLARGRLGVRGRLHAVWLLARAGGAAGRDRLFDLARHDPDPRVQAQAVRALADLADPVLTRHRLDAGPADPATAARFAALARGKDPMVLLEVIVALGRLRWADAPGWLARVLAKPDPALGHAAMQALRRSGNWPAVLQLLDRPDAEAIRAVALRALAEQAVPEVVDGLLERLRRETRPWRRREYADALARVCRKPGPWVYWGYRPPPRPPNTVAWERTAAIEEALNGALADPDRTVRLAVLRATQREGITPSLAALARWLRDEHEGERLTAILEGLRGQPAAATRPLLEAAVGERRNPPAVRLAALGMLADGLDRGAEARLLILATSLEDGPVLAETLRQIGKRAGLSPGPLLLDKVASQDPGVRAAAVEALATRGPAASGTRLPGTAWGRLLEDKDPGVRRAAVAAAGSLRISSAADALLRLARDDDPAVRRASLESLRLLRDRRALPVAVAALRAAETQVAALRCLADLGGPDQAGAVVDLARQQPSAEVLPLVLRMLTDWGRGAAPNGLDAAAADLQGASGVLARWWVAGPLAPEGAARMRGRVSAQAATPDRPDAGEGAWQTALGTGTEARLRLGPVRPPVRKGVWLAYTDVRMPEQAAVQFLACSGTAWRVWVNDKPAHRGTGVRPLRPDAERFEAVLRKGRNRVLVQLDASPAAEFHVRFRHKGSSAEHERLTEAALTRPGDAERGRKVFLDVAKSQCLKCHRLGNQGERIGPELTGVGARFPRIYLIESILEPSRTVAPEYQTVAVALKDGRFLSGVVVAESERTLTLGDNQGQTHVLRKTDIDERRPQALSTMPEGLEKKLTPDEFVDLIAFLAGQKQRRRP